MCISTGVSPIDFLLQVYYERSTKNNVDFVGAYARSYSCASISTRAIALGACRECQVSVPEPSAFKFENLFLRLSSICLNFSRRCALSVHRNLVSGMRDVSFIALQLFVMLSFGAVIGAEFFRLDQIIDASTPNFFSALAVIIDITSFTVLFKVYHIHRGHLRFHQEMCNGSISPWVYWASDLTSSALLCFSFLPGVALAHYMIGLPLDSLPFMMLVSWLVRCSSIRQSSYLPTYPPTYLPSYLPLTDSFFFLYLLYRLLYPLKPY